MEHTMRPIITTISLIFLTNQLTISTSVGKPLSLFHCQKEEGPGNVSDFNWNSYDYTGFKWISCTVETDVVMIDNVRLNRGNCGVLDMWFIDRRFTRGQKLNISYSCLSPVIVEIDANGLTSSISLTR
ncbi:hypothetical protein LBMAG20_02390 [Methylocystaceae bacterium]|nr:hypothetical protein LBMAG20_02390 [Methylocystaceae bacterium]